MRNIPQAEPVVGGREIQRLIQYFEKPGYLTEFGVTKEFEDTLAKFIGVKHCIALSSGMSALMALSVFFNIRPGSRVLVPAYSMIATAYAFRIFGANVDFYDIEEESLCGCPDSLERMISRDTALVVYVNINGRTPLKSVDRIKQITSSFGVPLIEDSAQGLGSYYYPGQHIGTKGDAAVLSFSPPKIITTGQGGAVITDNDDIATGVRSIKDFGRVRGGSDIHARIGFNGKFTDIQAAIGLAQMETLEVRIQQKKHIYERYREGLKDYKKICVLENDIAVTTPWFVEVVCETRSELMKHLSDFGIGTRVMYPPMPFQAEFLTSNQNKEHFKTATHIGERGLWLPSSPNLTDDELTYVIDKLGRF